MNLTLAEQLTSQFYLWEQRGRGWYIWDYPVQLEPPFEPFILYYPSDISQIDDGRMPTARSSFVEWLKKPFQMQNTEVDKLYSDEKQDDDINNAFECSYPIKTIEVVLPMSFNLQNEYMQQFLITLSVCEYPVSFEIISAEGSIQIQFACREPDYVFIKQSISTYFPEVVLSEGILFNGFNKHSVIIDFGLSDEFMCPIQTFKSFNPDPLLGLLGIMDNLRIKEKIVFQILFESAKAPWSEQIINSVTNYDGSSFFVDAPEMLPLVKEKLQYPLFSVVIRAMIQSDSDDNLLKLARTVGGGVNSYKRQFSNELIPLSNEGYEDSIHREDFELRQTHRSGMLLNSNELMGFVHFPTETKGLSNFNYITRKSRPAPVITQNNELILGDNIHQGQKNSVSLSQEQRLRHTYIIGATGTGKSTLLLNMIQQDMKNGLGVAVIDPHGELIEQAIGHIPDSRLNDVVIFDPGDHEYPVGLNILEARTEIEKNVLSSDLVALFRRFSTSWGDQMTTVLGNAISAFLENPEGGTLVELKRFLIEKEYRNQYLLKVKDDQIRYFWDKEFPLLRGKTESSILTRLDTFLRPKLIRNIISQRKGIDLEDILNSKKILLVKLSQGIIGDENAYLLGTLIVSKLHQVVMGRQSVDTTKRNPFYLYIDEFQNLVTPSMTRLLSGARKYAFGLILAHQDLRQLWSEDSALANSVITNPCTRICFRAGDYDAQKLSGGFAHYDVKDLQNLSIGEAIVRVERNENDFNINTSLSPDASFKDAKIKRETLYNLSREKYSDVSNIVNENYYKISSGTTELLKPNKNVDKAKVTNKAKKKSNTSNDQAVFSQHRYLQTLIKKMAEQRGYKAIIEKPVLDCNGRVDVSLERENEKIACEISVTTTKEHELNNIKKCLNAGYESIFICSIEQKHLDEIKKKSESELSAEEQKKVLYFQPERLFLYLEQKTRKQDIEGNENKVKGYRVNVSYNDVPEKERIHKERNIMNTILKSMVQMNKNKK